MMPAASSRSASPPNSAWRLANGAVRRKHRAQARQRSLHKQRIERSGDRRAGFPQFVVTTAQPFIRGQARQERASAVFVELVVDQGDKLRVVVVSHRFTKERSYFSFANAARAAASRLMTVPIGMASAAAASA